MNTFKDIELIEKYLADKLDEQEKRNMEKRLKKDRSFRIMKEEMEILISGIRKSAVKTTLEEKLEKIKDSSLENLPDEEEPENRKPKIRRIRIPKRSLMRKIANGLTAAILIGAIPFLIIRNQNPLGERVYMAYMEHVESPYGTLRGNSEEENVRDRAYMAYENQNYEEAIPLFEAIIGEKEEDTDAIFFLGISYLLTEDTQSAMPLLQKVASHPDYINTNSAKYYLSLLYIKEEKYEQAIPLLEKVVQGNDQALVKNSRKILRKID